MMQLHINPAGKIRCVYGEVIDLAELGELSIRRASHVEPDHEGHWWADLSPVGGPRLGPFAHRSPAFAAEEQWLTANLPGLEFPVSTKGGVLAISDHRDCVDPVDTHRQSGFTLCGQPTHGFSPACRPEGG
jgi:hypothetical protein